MQSKFCPHLLVCKLIDVSEAAWENQGIEFGPPTLMESLLIYTAVRSDSGPLALMGLLVIFTSVRSESGCKDCKNLYTSLLPSRQRATLLHNRGWFPYSAVISLITRVLGKAQTCCVLGVVLFNPNKATSSDWNEGEADGSSFAPSKPDSCSHSV